MHPPRTLLHDAHHPPWCCLVVSFDNIERRVGVYIPLRAPRVAAGGRCMGRVQLVTLTQ